MKGRFRVRFQKLQRPEKQSSWLDFQDFLKYMTELSNTVSKSKLKQPKTIVTRAYEKRFKRRRESRYGTINKGLTEIELQRFLRNVQNEKFILLFKYQANLGIRVGEVCKLHTSNIDFYKRELTINSESLGRQKKCFPRIDQGNYTG